MSFDECTAMSMRPSSSASSISLVNRNGVWIRVPVSLPVLLSVGMYRLCS